MSFTKISEDTSYMLPAQAGNTAEQNRLDVQHALFKKHLGGKLSVTEIPKEGLIVDLAAGSGIWAVEVAQERPEATVVGIDLTHVSAPAPTNCSFKIGDLREKLEFDNNSVDFVHSRALVLASLNWPDYLKEVYRILKPGCRAEFMEVSMAQVYLKKDGTPTYTGDNMNSDELGKALVEYGLLAQSSLDLASDLKGFVTAAGFKDVQEKVQYIPLGTNLFNDDKFERLKTPDEDAVEGGPVLDGMEAMAKEKLSPNDAEKIFRLTAETRKELVNRKLYAPLIYVSGQKS
ncbi:hypothetical protein Unana1_08905 [Umbelopsis nana]